jgi:hypothetical protein
LIIGTTYAHFTGMLLVIAILAIVGGSLLIVVNSLRRAPQGFEDEHGFHVVAKHVSGSGIVARKKRIPLHGSGSLKEARSNP